MALYDPKDLEDIDQDIRLNELEHEAEELAGGPIHLWQSDTCPPDLAEQFLRHVVDFENAPKTSHYQQLLEAGVKLPEADTLNERQVTAKLWEVINSLAALRVFLSQTNHLSDRELYVHLCDEALHEQTVALPGDEYSSCHIDLLSSGSADDNYLYLMYYADKEWRQQWRESFPEEVIPAHKKPPYDRDRLLPGR